MADEPRFLLILSDLHLSEGLNPDTGLLSRREDFFFDTTFGRFLSKHAQFAEKNGCRFELIFAGDLVDFQQVMSTPGGKDAQSPASRPWSERLCFGKEEKKRQQRLGLSTSADHTVWKLEQICAGHQVFFKALADFLARGHEVVILPGNHDIEWIIPEVQKAFKRIILRLMPDDPTRSNTPSIAFKPWFYHEEKLIYVEHGNQYDCIDSFDHLLCPFLPDGLLDLTAGCFFVRYLLNHVEFNWPFADNIKPPSRFILWALRRREGWRYLLEYLRFFHEICNKRHLPEGWSEELELVHAECLEEISSTTEIQSATLKKLKGLWELSALHNFGRWRLFRAILRGTPRSRALENKAYSIQKLLSVPYVVFGHTHEAHHKVFSEGGKKSEYFNSGTWTKVFSKSMEERLLTEESEFVYVQLDRQARKIDFLRWRDDLNAGESVRLFEGPGKKVAKEPC